MTSLGDRDASTPQPIEQRLDTALERTLEWKRRRRGAWWGISSQVESREQLNRLVVVALKSLLKDGQAPRSRRKDPCPVHWRQPRYRPAATLPARLSGRTPTDTYYYLTDGSGSAAALIGSSGDIHDTHSSDRYGNMTLDSEQVANPVRFDGAVWDSGEKLYAMGERYYDSTVGRWMQQDPSSGTLEFRCLLLYWGRSNQPR